MKIAILSFYSGSVTRGVENWTYELGKRLSTNNEVIVFQNRKPEISVPYKVVVSNLPFELYRKNGSPNLKRRLFLDKQSLIIAKFTLKNIGILFKEMPDIVIPANGGWQTFIIKILTLLTRKKMVIVSHSGIGWDERFNLLCFPDLFVALTPHLSKWSQSVNKWVKKINIPNGVDLIKFNPKGRKANVVLQKPIFVFAGSFNEEKGVKKAIYAVSNLKKGSLLVLGDGSNKASIEKLGLEKLDNRFSLKKVNYENMAQFYRVADVFTLPSWSSEAFGMVYLEALACGIPVVATNDETRRYIVGNAGILVDPTNIDDYAKSLEKASNTDWNNKPRIQAEKFSWDLIARKYEVELEKLIGK